MSDTTEKRHPVDVEKNAFDGPPAVEPGLYTGEIDGFTQPATGSWARFDAYNRKLEHKLGIETRGIERVPESTRPDKRLYGNTFIWLAANCVLPTFGVGILGPLVYYMSIADSMLTIFFFVVFSSLLPAFTSTFGPKLGLRQMTSSRFSWGFYGAKIVALLNCIACVGWSIANTIAGTQVLVAVSDWSMSDAVGVVIIAICTLIIGLFGYKFVHRFEQIAWVPTAITFFVLLGVSAKHLAGLPMPTGQAEAASVLSFGSIIFSFCVGWVSLASDYNVYMPADAKPWKVFAWTYLGIAVPCVLIMWLGAAIAATSFIVEDWGTAYTDHELGGLIHAVLVPAMGGGGKFFMVLLVLSVVANNIVNVYSMGLSISVISAWLAAVPRLVWPIVITAIYLPLSIVGANHFADTLEDFLSVLGYWLAIFVAVVLEEHFIFRKGKWENYNAAEAWNRKELLPHGFAAIAAGCVGVAGAVIGMAQIWYIGPVGAAVGGAADAYGGDIGFELSFAFTALTFPPLRYLELKYFHK